MTAAGLKAATLDDPRLQTQRGDPQLGCGLLIADRVRDGQGTVGVLAEKCTRWPQEWPARLDIDRTEVAVVQTGPWETFDLGFDDVDGWRHLGDPVVDERATVLLHQAIDLLSSRGAHVVLVTTSHVDEDVRGGPGPCSCPERLDRWNELLRAAAAAHPERASVIDLQGWLLSLGPEEDARLRPDGMHFSEATATEVADRWLVDQLLALPRNAVDGGPAATTTG
jgi:hypothetical protein